MADTWPTRSPYGRHFCLKTMNPTRKAAAPLPTWCVNLIERAAQIADLPTAPQTTEVLKLHTGLTAQALRVQLELAGWHRELVWSRSPDWRRVLTPWWCPPGTHAPRTPRGRPRVYLTYAEAMALINS